MHIVLLFTILASQAVNAHELRYEVVETNAVGLHISHEDGAPFSLQRYELYRDEDENPTQTGYTTENGNLYFVSDHPGAWRIKAFATNGHGIDARVSVSASGDAKLNNTSLFDRYARLIVGVSLLFGAFGILQLFYRR